MVRFMGVVVLAGVLGGCTSVKMVQRDGCWVRETSRTLGGTKQEIGPCARPQPQWSEDRLTRLVQECVAQADHRFQLRAVSAWNRGEPLPAQEPEESVVALCMSQAATGAVTETERLSERLSDVKGNLAELAKEREALRAESTQAVEHLRASNDRISEYLGEAAKRPPPVATATATATSDGTALTESGLQSETGSTAHTLPAARPPLPFVPAAATPAAPAPQPSHPGADAYAPPATPAPAAAPEPGSADPLKKALKKAQARRKPVVRATSAQPCETPKAAACEVPAGEARPTGEAAPAGQE